MPLYSLSLSKRIDVQIEELKYHRSEIFPLLACLCAEVNKAEFAGKCPVNIYMETDYANIPAIWKQHLLHKEEIYLKSVTKLHSCKTRVAKHVQEYFENIAGIKFAI